EVVFTPLLTNNCDNFNDGLSLAYTKPDRSGFGFFNRNNQWVVEPIYDHVTSFKGGRAIVEKDGKLGVIDTTGNYIIPLEYVNIYGDCGSHGLLLAVKDNVSYFLNCDGKPFTDKDVKYIYGSNSGQLHPFTGSFGKMGYMKKDGSIFINAVYNNAEPFSEGKAWVY
ncbi:MAG: WG repeat-containing protein, partial [Bacteroidales bacterium]|nr:WG repeat-containing protein [Bacteroidales bacterium]